MVREKQSILLKRQFVLPIIRCRKLYHHKGGIIGHITKVTTISIVRPRLVGLQQAMICPLPDESSL